MSEIDDGGTAFPVEGGPNSQLISQYGLSKREWFAGMALQGALSRGVEGVEV